MSTNQPIIIKRVKKVVGGHHGGAWKIAFADFAVAMMAFFLVMWLLSSATPEQKKAISGYFQDPIGFSSSASPYVIDLGGTPTPAPDNTLNPELPEDSSMPQMDPDEDLDGLMEQLEQERLQMLLLELQAKVDENDMLRPYREQIHLSITQEGLRIQIVDDEKRPMFALGSARLQTYFEDILYMMAGSIRSVPNKISIGGHTDAKPYSGQADFGNWELSSGRANAARRALHAGGLEDNQVARVAGYASSVLFDRKNPYSPVNRRIDIVVLTKKAQQDLEEQAEEADAGTEAQPSTAPAGRPARERMNLFEDGLLQLEQGRG
ncbi:flagellar motor protein MotB [Thiopseudomonas denitrificans]|uniref:Chemotaxis protein MotB n=1 Tax=Thiopseudomonas denitrificans TaxID=1501432 RepID=A0A4V3D4M6_9GAMM|nr:flagellar motor protein MotB [Thiopseudomonas denitrificans]TDQ36857.1 chemotaxis protein MotB [Thiopseudomonas denitrificans]